MVTAMTQTGIDIVITQSSANAETSLQVICSVNQALARQGRPSFGLFLPSTFKFSMLLKGFHPLPTPHPSKRG